MITAEIFYIQNAVKTDLQLLTYIRYLPDLFIIIHLKNRYQNQCSHHSFQTGRNVGRKNLWILIPYQFMYNFLIDIYHMNKKTKGYIFIIILILCVVGMAFISFTLKNNARKAKKKEPWTFLEFLNNGETITYKTIFVGVSYGIII